MKIINSICKKISDLNIDVEDTLVSNLSLKKKGNLALCSIHLNFLRDQKKEKFQLLEKKGKIEADFNKKIVAIFIKNKKKDL